MVVCDRQSDVFDRDQSVSVAIGQKSVINSGNGVEQSGSECLCRIARNVDIAQLFKEPGQKLHVRTDDRQIEPQKLVFESVF